MNEADKCLNRILSGETLAVKSGVTIDGLPPARSADIADLIEIQKGNLSQSITMQQIRDLVGLPPIASNQQIDNLR